MTLWRVFYLRTDVKPTNVSTPELPEEQALLVETAKGVVRIPFKRLKKITPAMARVIECLAFNQTIEQIAEAEKITVHGINKRLQRVHKLLKMQNTITAYRILLLARILILK